MKGCIESLETLQSDLDFAIQITSTERYVSRGRGLHRKVGTSSNTLRSALLREYLDSYKGSVRDTEVENEEVGDLLPEDETTSNTVDSSVNHTETVEEVSGNSFLDSVRKTNTSPVSVVESNDIEEVSGNSFLDSVRKQAKPAVEEVSSNSFLSAVKGMNTAPEVPEEPVIQRVNLEELLGLTPKPNENVEESYRRHGVYVESIMRHRRHAERRAKRMEERSRHMGERSRRMEERSRRMGERSRRMMNRDDMRSHFPMERLNYTSKGRYIEDIVNSYVEEPKENVDVIPVASEDSSSHVSNGVYVEDIVSSQPETSTGGVFDEDESVGGSSSSSGDLWEDADDEDKSVESNNSSSENLWEDEDEESTVVESENKNTESENENIDPILSVVESENKNFNQKVETESIIESENKNINSEKEKSRDIVKDSDLEKSKSENEKIDVPKDIRTFLKLHPSSTVEFVARYYPKKEIEKQLALGRIYKRKGKLMI